MTQWPAILVSVLALSLAPASHAQTTTTSLAGVGDSNARPAGAWALPDGVVLARPINGYSVFMPEGCAPPEDPEKTVPPQGAGSLVQLCLALRHTGQRNGAPFGLPLVVEIPPGVIFISDDISTQNGIIIQRFIVELRPGETIYVPVLMMCLNDNRSPSHPGSVYEIGPLLQNPAFDALFRRLEGKRITQEAEPAVQMAVWALSEGDEIPDLATSQIDALPDA